MALQDKLQQVIKAALDGPSIKDISIKGHDFNVDKVKQKVTVDGKVVIDGWGGGDNISHRRTVVFDDHVNYRFTVQVTNAGVDITDIKASIKKGGLWNTWGAPIISVINLWDEIGCFFDDEKELEDCDHINLVKALYNAVKRDSSEFEIGEINEISISELENQSMLWKEVAELMILSIAAAVVWRQIAFKKPDWNTNKNPIQIVAPDFDGNQVAIGVNRGVLKNKGFGVSVLFDSDSPPVLDK